ncbi:MAG: hypothetical protein EOP83_07410 [Verrucomicrobiaceae bacterium]|nr:MAG: hypothetical protein EOP83_07410 [Verrucomicrobiaceae bacterium]
MYAKRVSDNADWYVTVQSEEFATAKLLATALPVDGKHRVAAVTKEFQSLFPQNHLLLEINGYEGTDPQGDLGGMVYDSVTKTLSPAPVVVPPVVPVTTNKADIWRRATDEEAEQIVAVLNQQTIRKQRLFNDAQYIDHADAEWADLFAAFTQAFGEDRANELLAPSVAS